MLEMTALIHYHHMQITPQFSFLKSYVMGRPEIHSYGIVHVKVDFIPPPKRYVTLSLGRFV